MPGAPVGAITIAPDRGLTHTSDGRTVASEQTQPEWKHRVLALGFYFGLAPFFWRSRLRRDNTFLHHHAEQAVALFFVLLLILLLFAFVIAVLSYTMIYHRGLYDRIHPEGRALSVTRKLFLCWLVFWAYGGGLAVAGSPRHLPLIAFLARRKRLLSTTVLAWAILYGAMAAAIPVTVHAASLARCDDAPAEVYMLYENVGRFPRWLFTLGFYRVSAAARERWGPDSAVVVKLSEDAIRSALRQGRFVFIGSHGMAQGLLLERGFLKPEDIQAMGVNPELEFVYLTSCDSGTQKERWEKAFAPARVITYDRLTAVVEHAWWLWARGPDVVRQLK